MNVLSAIPDRFRIALRDKAIGRAKTRIVLAGKRPEDFAPDDLEVVVREEEEKIKSEIKEKGLLAVFALLGISWLG